MIKWFASLFIIIFSLTSTTLSAQSPNHHNLIYLYGATSNTYKKQLEQTNGQVGTLIPNYFNLTKDGQLVVNVDTDFVAYAKKKGYRITPFISNHWDQQVGIQAMANRVKLADDLAAAVLKNDLDGINIDIENLTYAERDLQTEFLKRLTDKLKPHGKTVSIAVAPARFDTTKGWVGSYDFEAIGKIVDVVFIMGYDQSYPNGPEGPVAGLPWVEESVKYFIKKMPKEKIVLGVPFYGRYWTETNRGHGIHYPVAMNLMNKNNATMEYDAVNSTMKSKFTDQASGKKYEIWFDNADTILERIKLVEKYQLKGWGAWHLGQEDTRIWTALQPGNQPFRDIASHWAKKDILAMKDRELLRGYSDDTFRPGQQITREEVATLLTQALRFDIKKDGGFKDVSASRWSFPYVSTISVYGMMKGYPDQTFRPAHPITRAEFAAALARSFAVTPKNGTESSFSDIHQHWAREDIVKLQQAGILSGYQDGSFRPDQTVSRAETAAMLHRILQ
ncbi:S-layer homology domain-containing protein [Ammoniphilus sp. CFH 90114]|uniref:S-layer homology domain-containing protein n=1 Tax=Ammoniphilus sp. CFH 90114 TaxID=2493665 RepID=UPI0013E90DE9|nr:S-layer homology domain-containing protein [Ammoniphilus sp. CFH 90114]